MRIFLIVSMYCLWVLFSMKINAIKNIFQLVTLVILYGGKNENYI